MLQAMFTQRPQGSQGSRSTRCPRSTHFPLFCLPVLFALFGPSIISCDSPVFTDASVETILVTLPPPHPVHALLTPSDRTSPRIQPSYTARWYDSDGQKQTLTHITDEFFITLETGLCTPILLESETASFGIPDGALPVAGALYPAHGRVSAMGTGMTPVVETSWMRGISASLAESICVSSAGGFASGRNIAGHYNWQRFESGLSDFSDPSRINRARFVHAVLSGHFAKSDISCLKTIPVDTDTIQSIPAQCTLFSSWPESSGYSHSVAESAPLPACEGINRYFCQTGFLTVQITLGKETCAFFTPYILQD